MINPSVRPLEMALCLQRISRY